MAAPKLKIITSESCVDLLNPAAVARFEGPLLELREFLPSKTSEDLEPIVEKIVKEDGRKHTFFIESLTRLYKDVYGEPFKTLRKEFKTFEDTIGAYTDVRETLEFAQRMDAPKEVLQVLTKREARSRAEVINFIKEHDWTKSKVDELRTALTAFEWKPQFKENAKIIGAMTERLREYEKLDFDMTDLEGERGIHKLRRRIRWFLIELQALQGLVKLEDSKGPQKLNEYKYLIDHPIASSPFSKIKEHPSVENPIGLSRHLFLAASKIVQELGHVKTYGEYIESLASAYIDAGLATSESDAFKEATILAKKDPKYVETYSGAKKIHKELARTGLIKHLRKYFSKYE